MITYKMKEQMKRTVYEAPLTELFQIELEGGFMAGSVVNSDDDTAVETTGQELGTDIDGSAWDNTSWE